MYCSSSNYDHQLRGYTLAVQRSRLVLGLSIFFDTGCQRTWGGLVYNYSHHLTDHVDSLSQHCANNTPEKNGKVNRPTLLDHTGHVFT